MPVTFPLSLNGTTVAFFVSYRAETGSMTDLIAASAVGVAYGAVTGLTLIASGFLEKRAKFRSRIFLEKITGILLTATAASLIASGSVHLAVDMIKAYSR